MEFHLLLVFLQVLAASALTNEGASISSDPPGPVYPASRWVKFMCTVNNHPNPGELRFEWHGFANSSSTEESIFSVTDPMFDAIDQAAYIWVSSTSPVRHLQCRIFNSSETMVKVWKDIIVTGIGVRIEGTFRGEVWNNTSILSPATLRCESALNCTSHAEWQGPGMMESISDCSNGYASAVLSVQPSLPPGLYSCVSPEQLHTSGVFIGIYNDLEQRILPFQTSITTDFSLSGTHLTLSCSTSHLPASSVQWMLDSVILDLALYNHTKLLQDITDTHYTNSIAMDWSRGGLAVIECFIFTEWISDSYDPYYDSSRATGNFLIVELGSSVNAYCGPSNFAIEFHWAMEGELSVEQIPGLVEMGGALVFSRIESLHHGLQFSCQGLDSAGNIVHAEHFTLIVFAPADLVEVYLVDNRPQVIEHGSSHTMTCCYNASLLVSPPSLHWFENGLEITSGVTTDDRCSSLNLPSVNYQQNNWVYTCSAQWIEPILFIGPSSHIAETMLSVASPPTTQPPVVVTTQITTVAAKGTGDPGVIVLPIGSANICHSLPALALALLVLLTIVIT